MYFKGKNPQITTVTGVSFYNDELSVGSTAVTIDVNDPDLEDMDELTLTITNVDNSGLTYFEITNSLTNCKNFVFVTFLYIYVILFKFIWEPY